MTVVELIEKLKKMPPRARVFHIWDGEPRTGINIVYKSRCGAVMTADWGEVVYSTNARPKDAPTSEENKHWCLPDFSKSSKHSKDDFIDF
jgi:hypothetical protein